MTTRVWDYRLEYESERDDILDAVETVFESGRLILGQSVRGFEEEFAAYHGVPHAVAVTTAPTPWCWPYARWASGPEPRS